MTKSIRDNLSEVWSRIERAASAAGRSPSRIELIAVTKTQPPERIREAYEAGQRLFGENLVQEFEAKRAKLDLPAAFWHLIGHLQSNKAARAAQLFNTIETVDSERLARRLDAAAAKAGRRLPVLIEVKLSPEPTKSGCGEQELPDLVASIGGMQHLELRGLMTVPPFSENPDDARPYFARLREWADRLDLPELSMGMTHDFEAAVEEGATMVRVGTAIFGARPVK